MEVPTVMKPPIYLTSCRGVTRCLAPTLMGGAGAWWGVGAARAIIKRARVGSYEAIRRATSRPPETAA
jgi:hypothetical protein